MLCVVLKYFNFPKLSIFIVRDFNFGPVTSFALSMLLLPGDGVTSPSLYNRDPKALVITPSLISFRLRLQP